MVIKRNYISRDDIVFPFKFYEKRKPFFYDRFGYCQVFEQGLLFNTNKIIYLVDPMSKNILWDLRGRSISNAVCTSDSKILLTYDNNPTCLNGNDGELLWRIASNESISNYHDNGIFSIASEIIWEMGKKKRKATMFFRTHESGDVIWKTSAMFNYPKVIECEGEIVLVVDNDNLYALQLQTGKMLWNHDLTEFFQIHFPDNDYGQLINYNHRIARCWGPHVMGKIILGFDGNYLNNTNGHLVALNIKTGELAWNYDLLTTAAPSTIVCYKDKLYFDLAQGMGKRNYLSCIDADDGKFLYRTEENFTPEGSTNPLLYKNFLFTGHGRYLSVFDLDNQDFVWHYEHKTKEDVFTSSKYIINDQFIVFNDVDKIIYWFNNDGDLSI